MVHVNDMKCALCHLSKETKITGALSTKENVTAHQNCLLYSSGIYCQDSPRDDDLFGFSVNDVKEEVKRGRKLKCSECKRSGATAGCENSRCKKSYHYPCAVKDGAEIFEETDAGKYGLYCPNHRESNGKNGSVNRRASSHASTSEAPPSEVYCLTCEKKEGKISLESLSDNAQMSYCDKHAPSSLKRNTNGLNPSAKSHVQNSDSNPSSSTNHTPSKRWRISDDDEDLTPSKRKSKRRISDSSNSDEEAPNSMFAPLDSDLLEGNSLNHRQILLSNLMNICALPPCTSTVPQLIRKETVRDRGSSSGNHPDDQSRAENKNGEEDETLLHSDAESESLLSPQEICVEIHPTPTITSVVLDQAQPAPVQMENEDNKGSRPKQNLAHSPERPTAQPSAQPQSSPALPFSLDRPKPRSVTTSPPSMNLTTPPAPTEADCISVPSSPSSAGSLPRNPDPSIDSTSFWKSCNTAGCTQAIFTDFMNEMSSISDRIQSDKASREDYDRALAVLEASGKLAEFVTKQQKELQRKQVELEKAAAVMSDIVTSLKQ
ncbi:uncharacterized protein LOC108901283 [Xyrichtys novacula]|uniref:Uncharacterized protein LOC108901283 n=1 Tax=Xyrichtys novacula TaxID=13765 RepID=A0AAV1H0X8_XYRNO|nr:uncharacterized protein LOC108901283 [Xyrichtys novacula]